VKETPWGLWDPLAIPELAEVLHGLEARWWVAGGFALEAFVGRRWREHDDIDAAVRREDQEALRDTLIGWDVHVADPPGTLRPWLAGEHLDAAIHDIWVRRDATSPWRFQLMLDESDGDDWVFRRDARIRLPMTGLTWEHDGLLFIKPEVQLLYKSRGRRAKDEVDLRVVLPLLQDGARRWLVEALELADPSNPWLPTIRSRE